jgi:hypothetical protein
MGTFFTVDGRGVGQIPDAEKYPNLKHVSRVKPGERFRLLDVFGIWEKAGNYCPDTYLKIDSSLQIVGGGSVECVNMTKYYVTHISAPLAHCCEVIDT